MQVFGYNIIQWEKQKMRRRQKRGPFWWLLCEKLPDMEGFPAFHVEENYKPGTCHIEFGGDPLSLQSFIPAHIEGDIDHAKSIIDNILLRLSKLEAFQ